MERSADRDHDASAGAGGKLPATAATPAASLGAPSREQILGRALYTGMAFALPLGALWWGLVSATLGLAFFATESPCAAVSVVRLSSRSAWPVHSSWAEFNPMQSLG